MNFTKKIILTHIPKCAGTSFRRSVIAPNISESMWYRPGSFLSILTYKKDFQYIVGHFPLGIEKFVHRLNPARKRNTIHITFLREPVDHMISYYYFQLQLGKKSKYYPEIKSQDIVEFYQNNHSARNMQSRFCAGVLTELFFRKIFHSSENAFLLYLAKKNIIKSLDFVGRFEKLNIDMERFARSFNLNYHPTYSQTTKTKNRPKIAEISIETQKQLKRINRTDVRLYNYALETIWR